MKKIFTFVALVAMAMVANAQASYDLNNPIGQDGRYIVKWDCAKGQFAESNNFEPGETFTFAVDITGTGWVDQIQAGGPQGSTRCMAANIWTNYGPKKDATNRLKHIQGLDTIVYTYCQLFIFAYTEENNGVEWYVDAQQVQAPASDCFFATIPSTGKSDPEFYSDDYDEGMYGISEKGYAAPCVSAAAGVENTEIKAKSAKFIENGQLYIISNGVKYNALGAEVK